MTRPDPSPATGESINLPAEIILDATHVMRCPFDTCARCTEIALRYAPHGVYKTLEEAIRMARTYALSEIAQPAVTSKEWTALVEASRQEGFIAGQLAERTRSAIAQKPVAWQAKHPGEIYEWFQTTKEVFDGKRHGAYEYRELYAAPVSAPTPAIARSDTLGAAGKTGSHLDMVTTPIAPAAAYVLAIQQSVGNILSQYAANKILDRAKEIENGH